MLKVIPPTTNCGCGYFKTKCAEIHYQASNFSILCIFCGMTTLLYSEFLEHFENHHFEDFTKATCTAEQIVYEENRVTTHRRTNNDPLEFGERETTENPEDVLKKLQQNQIEVKEFKVEIIHGECVETRLRNCQKNSSGAEQGRIDVAGQAQVTVTAALADDEPFTDSDNEFLICKVKVEQYDLNAANPTTPQKFTKCHTTKNYKSEEHDVEKNSDSDDSSESSSSQSKHSTTDVVNSEDVDWTKPYEPNLLKNHEKRPYKPRNKPNICTYCGRTFRRRYQLDTHLNIHTGSKPHQCEICGRQFRAVTTLTRHLNTHEQREAYTCKFCAKAFTHKAALISHELRHTQERNVPCDECDKYFYTVNQMDTHKRKCHKANEDKSFPTLPFVCEFCSKRYRSASMLSTHKFKKHYKTAKFSCEKCDKKFIDEQQLERHKLIHVDGLSINLK